MTMGTEVAVARIWLHCRQSAKGVVRPAEQQRFCMTFAKEFDKHAGCRVYRVCSLWCTGGREEEEEEEEEEAVFIRGVNTNEDSPNAQHAPHRRRRRRRLSLLVL